MTARTNARVAGAAYLLYLVAGIGGMAAAGYTPARDVLNTLVPFCAVALGVTLYELTRDVDEGISRFLAWRYASSKRRAGNGEIFFAAGNAVFCWLLLRGRLIPSALAGLGLAWSIFLTALLFLQAGGMFGGARGLVVSGHVARVAAAARLRIGVRHVAAGQRGGDAAEARPLARRPRDPIELRCGADDHAAVGDRRARQRHFAERVPAEHLEFAARPAAQTCRRPRSIAKSLPL